MLVALAMLLSFIGYRTQRLASMIGGFGFGLFIDELGKFVTSDNNYFYQPSIAIIYIVFFIMFISFRRISHVAQMTQTEYLLNALALAEEAVVNDLDNTERLRVLDYLKRADASSPLVIDLTDIFNRVEPIVEAEPGWLARSKRAVEDTYRELISSKVGIRVVDGVVVAKSIWSVVTVGVALTVAAAFSQVPPQVIWLQLISASFALILSLAGVVAMRTSRLQAYNLFIKSVLVELLLTQFFDFYRQEFAALPFFIINILIYVSLRFLANEERRLLLRQEDITELPNSPLPAV